MMFFFFLIHFRRCASRRAYDEGERKIRCRRKNSIVARWILTVAYRCCCCTSHFSKRIYPFFCSLLLSLSRDRERFDGVCLRRKSVNEKYYTARAHRYSVSILRAECIRLDFVIHEEFDVRKAHSHSRCKLGAAAARNMKKEFINENARHARKYSILATLKKVTELSWIQHGYGGLCHAHPSSGVCILSQSRHSISFYGHGIHKNESLNEVSVDGKFHTTTKSYNIP